MFSPIGRMYVQKYGNPWSSIRAERQRKSTHLTACEAFRFFPNLDSQQLLTRRLLHIV